MLFKCTGTVPGTKVPGTDVILEPVAPMTSDTSTKLTISTWLLTPLFEKSVFEEGQIFDVTIHAVGDSVRHSEKYDISKASSAS